MQQLCDASVAVGQGVFLHFPLTGSVAQPPRFFTLIRPRKPFLFHENRCPLVGGDFDQEDGGIALRSEGYAMKGTRRSGQPVITFTGERHEAHFRVRLERNTAELTANSLKGLVCLVLARASPGSGFIRLDPVTINRLRHSLDEARGAGTGQALIETGYGEDYRLRIPVEDLSTLVAIEPAFFELEGLGVISSEQVEGLRRACRLLGPGGGS
jgi:hypothetical protein